MVEAMADSDGDFPDGYRVFDPIDPFENGAGPFYCPNRDDGDPRFVFLAEPRHCNTGGVLHGGLLMTLADLALCATACRDLPEERAITVAMNTEFVAAGVAGDLVVARGEVIRRTGSLVFLRGQVAVGERILINCSSVVKRVKRG